MYTLFGCATQQRSREDSRDLGAANKHKIAPRKLCYTLQRALWHGTVHKFVTCSERERSESIFFSYAAVLVVSPSQQSAEGRSISPVLYDIVDAMYALYNAYVYSTSYAMQVKSRALVELIWIAIHLFARSQTENPLIAFVCARDMLQFEWEFSSFKKQGGWNLFHACKVCAILTFQLYSNIFIDSNGCAQPVIEVRRSSADRPRHRGPWRAGLHSCFYCSRWQQASSSNTTTSCTSAFAVSVPRASARRALPSIATRSNCIRPSCRRIKRR